MITTTQDTSLTATTGSITNLDNDSLLSANTLNLSANTNIGTDTNTYSTSTNSLDITNSSNIYLDEINDIVLNDDLLVENLVLKAKNITLNNSITSTNLTLDATSDLKTNIITATNTTISANSLKNIDTTNSLLTSTNLTINNTDVGTNTDKFNTSVTNLTVDAPLNSIYLNETDDINLLNIDVANFNLIAEDVISNIVTVSNDITLDARSLTNQTPTSLLSATNLSLNDTEIGTATDKFNTNIENLTIDAPNNNIYLNEKDSINLGGITANNIDITAKENIVQKGTLKSNNGDISIASTNASIEMVEGAQTSTTGNLSYDAHSNLTVRNLDSNITSIQLSSEIGLVQDIDNIEIVVEYNKIKDNSSELITNSNSVMDNQAQNQSNFGNLVETFTNIKVNKTELTFTLDILENDNNGYDDYNSFAMIPIIETNNSVNNLFFDNEDEDLFECWTEEICLW